MDVVDPHADSDELEHEYGYRLNEVSGRYDAILVAVNHTEYVTLDATFFTDKLNPGGLVVDLKGIFRNKLGTLNYWSL